MVRIFGILTGLFFVVALLWSLATGAYTAITEPAEETVEHAFQKSPKNVHFASDGPFGKFDRQQLQRGFQVYKEVCAACHSLRLVAFRDLAQLGYNEAEVKAIAASFQVPGVDPETGEANTRPGLPTDYMPKPYSNDVAARAANNNAIPPDLSLMAKARHHGDQYIYSLLTGYQRQEGYRNEEGKELLKEFPDAKTGPGLYFNPYFANLNIAMAPPLTGTGQVTYGPGNPQPTVQQMAKDVSAFLVWTAEPKLDKRNQTGWPVVLFLLIATILAYLAYQNVWRPVKGNH
jgi:ubiquinol-cytochrome c reductase cytochrome c1 subunit